MLTALPGDDERDARRARLRRGGHQRVRLGAGDGIQARGQFGEIGGTHHRPVAPDPPGAQQLCGHLGDADLGAAAQVPTDGLRVGGDQILGVRAQQHRDAAVGPARDARHWAISTITWVLVPLMPNADTAAIRAPFVAGHGCSFSASRRPWLSQSISPLRSSTCRVGGMVPRSAAMSTLARPSAPAAAWVCPTLDFTDPSTGPAPGAVAP